MASTSCNGTTPFQRRATPRKAQNSHRQFDSATGTATPRASASVARRSGLPVASRGKV
jgi:hypothetical protein